MRTQFFSWHTPTAACMSLINIQYMLDSGECAICLDELEQGDTIARLPCLCIYHKGCIDEWFEVNRSCPEHPSD
uniref:E3 ubiquitin-protein ligase ZNRF1 n=1 Tax=Sander lucioperca TaxID=283035 RepID=A0A8D0ABE6_SANLU